MKTFDRVCIGAFLGWPFAWACVVIYGIAAPNQLIQDIGLIGFLGGFWFTIGLFTYFTFFDKSARCPNRHL